MASKLSKLTHGDVKLVKKRDGLSSGSSKKATVTCPSDHPDPVESGATATSTINVPVGFGGSADVDFDFPVVWIYNYRIAHGHTAYAVVDRDSPSFLPDGGPYGFTPAWPWTLTVWAKCSKLPGAHKKTGH